MDLTSRRFREAGRASDEAMTAGEMGAMRICSMTSFWPTMALLRFGFDADATDGKAFDGFAFFSEGVHLVL